MCFGMHIGTTSTLCLEFLGTDTHPITTHRNLPWLSPLATGRIKFKIFSSTDEDFGI